MKTANRIRWHKKSGFHLAVYCGYSILLLLIFGYVASFSEIANTSNIQSQLGSIISSHLSVPEYFLACVYIWYLTRQERVFTKPDISVWLASLALSLLFVCGSAISQAHTFAVLTANFLMMLAAVASILTLAVFFYTLITPLFAWLDAHALASSNAASLGKLSTEEGVRNWGALFGIFLLAWSPYIITFLPGSVCPDMTWQLDSFTGNAELSAHHPLASTALYGTVFSIGLLIGSTDIGILLITLMQSVWLAFALTFQIYTMKETGAPRSIRLGAMLLFAIYPLFGGYCQWDVKDTIFSATFALYVSLFVLAALKQDVFFSSPKWIAILACAIIAVGLLRNNGLYVVALSAPFLCFLIPRSRQRWQVLAICIGSVLLIPLINLCLMTATGATPGSVKEALSIPFQQTARYALEHPDDIEDWEHEAINDVLDYDRLSELYNWDISDPVKGTYRGDNEKLPRYFSAWAAQGLRYPLTYLNAFGDQTYGYWTIMTWQNYDRELVGFGSKSFHDRTDWMPDGPRNVIAYAAAALCNLPLLGFLSQAGTYTWLMLIMAAYCLHRKCPRALVILLPCFVLLLTCIAGPLNGSIRYAFGIICAMPITLWGAYQLSVYSPRKKQCIPVNESSQEATTDIVEA